MPHLNLNTRTLHTSHAYRRILLLLCAACLLITTPAAAEDTSDDARQQDDSTTNSLFQRADEILETVGKIRGLHANKEVGKSFLTKDELHTILLTKLSEEMTDEEIENEAKVLKRLELIEPNIVYKDFLLNLYTEQIAGFYDNETAELYIMEGQDPALLDAVLSHELFHAIQDQHFSIARLREGGEENSDLMMARMALIEGDATAVMIDFELYPATTFSDIPFLAAVMRSSVDLTGSVGGEVMANAPLVIRESLVFPYIEGMLFIAEHKRTGGWDAVNAIYHDPPLSTEQILHPERYNSDTPVEIRFELPSAISQHYTPLHDNVTGELGLMLYLKQHASPLHAPSPPDAAAGWDGDRTLAVESPDEHVIYLHLSAWDSEHDAEEFALAMVAVAKHRAPTAKHSRHATINVLTDILDSGLETTLIERRGANVLHIEGGPSAKKPAGRAALRSLCDTTWNTMRQAPYPHALAVENTSR